MNATTRKNLHQECFVIKQFFCESFKWCVMTAYFVGGAEWRCYIDHQILSELGSRWSYFSEFCLWLHRDMVLFHINGSVFKLFKEECDPARW